MTCCALFAVRSVALFQTILSDTTLLNKNRAADDRLYGVSNYRWFRSFHWEHDRVWLWKKAFVEFKETISMSASIIQHCDPNFSINFAISPENTTCRLHKKALVLEDGCEEV